MATNHTLKLADWARMYFDIEEVRKRILLNMAPEKWRNLSEEQKLKKTTAVVDQIQGIKLGQEVNGFADDYYDRALVVNWQDITDLEAYGIERPQTDLHL